MKPFEALKVLIRALKGDLGQGLGALARAKVKALSKASARTLARTLSRASAGARTCFNGPSVFQW